MSQPLLDTNSNNSNSSNSSNFDFNDSATMEVTTVHTATTTDLLAAGANMNNNTPRSFPGNGSNGVPDDTLILRLRSATTEELDQLAEVCGVPVAEGKDREQLVEEISAKIRYHASSYVMYFFRAKHEFPYKKMLIDVADKVSEGYTVFSWTPYRLSDDTPEEEIEDFIWQECERMVRHEIHSLSPEKRQKLEHEVEQQMTARGLQGEALKAFSAAGMSMLIGSIVTEMIVLRVLFGAGSRSLLTLFGVEASTGVGIVVAAVSVVAVLQGTSYRITIPCAIRLISVRKRIDVERNLAMRAMRPPKTWEIRHELHGYGEPSMRMPEATDSDGNQAQTINQNAGDAPVGAGPQVGALSPPVHELRERLLKASWFARESMLMEELDKKELRLSCEEASALIELLMFSTAKREAIVKVFPLLTDKGGIKENLINTTLDDEYDRKAAMEELKQSLAANKR